MQSIPLAMTWEMLRRGRWALIGTMLAANMLPAIVFSALKYDGAFDPEDRSTIALHVPMMLVNMFIFGLGIFVAHGDPSRLYAFPIPTSSLVAWHLLPAMVLVALESVVSTAVLNAVFHLGWPLWGPAMFLGVALAALDAVRWWLTDKSAWFPFTLALVAALLGCWYKSRYGPILSEPVRWWLAVTPEEVATMLAIAALAYYAAVMGVARNRRGDALPSLGIIAWLERTFDSAPEAGAPFRTAAHAQFWFEWRKKGWVMPAGVLFLMLFGFSYWLIFSREPEALFEGVITGGGLLSLVGLIGGVIIGNSGPNDANFEMGHFLATRPMTNTDMARTILKAAAQSVLVAWVIWAVALLALYVILLAIQVVPEPALPKELGWWYFPATLLGPWIVVTSLASIGLTGRSRPFLELFCGLLALLIGLSLFSKYALSHQAQLQLSRGLAAASGAVFVLGTAWALVAAHRRSLIGSPTAYVAFGIWAAFSTLVVLEWRLHPAEPLATYVFVVGLLALAVAPLAAAPLAVAWNRNR